MTVQNPLLLLSLDQDAPILQNPERIWDLNDDLNSSKPPAERAVLDSWLKLSSFHDLLALPSALILEWKFPNLRPLLLEIALIASQLDLFFDLWTQESFSEHVMKMVLSVNTQSWLTRSY